MHKLRGSSVLNLELALPNLDEWTEALVNSALYLLVRLTSSRP